jgi:predicted AlkP superfamily phosphohydrolase/phosphomutase/Flp pilus assembly protein TadD
MNLYGFIKVFFRISLVSILFFGFGQSSAFPENDSRMILFGVDGADWKIAEPLIESGQLPHIARLRSEGVYGDFESVEPMLSPMLWTTIATGKYPEKHGILDFIAVDHTQGRVVPVSSNLRKARTVWDILGEYDHSVGVVGWLVTWPLEPVRGALVSDRLVYHAYDPEMDYSFSDDELASPPQLAAELPRLRKKAEQRGKAFLARFHLDNPALKSAELSEDEKERVEELRRLLQSMAMTQEVSLYVYRHFQPDFFAVYYEYIDAVCHLFMKYTPPDYPGVTPEKQSLFGQWIAEIYRLQDELIGEFLPVMAPETDIVIISDHGFLSGENRPPVDSRIGSGGASAWHRQYGVFVWNGPSVKKTGRYDQARLVDIAPSVLAVFGVPIGRDMDGQPLDILLDQSPGRQWVATHEKPREEEDLQAPLDAIPSELDEEILNRLKALGYLGGHSSPPADVEETAVQSKYNLGLSLEKRGKYEEAIQVYQEILLEKPTHETGRFHLAFCLMQLDRWKAAANVLQGLLNLNPENIQVHNNLAYCFIQMGKREKALNIYQKLIQEFPEDPRGYANLGAFFLQQGQLSSAQAFLEKSLQLNPEDPQVKENLGMCLIQLGKIEQEQEHRIRAQQIRAEQSRQ